MENGVPKRKRGFQAGFFVIVGAVVLGLLFLAGRQFGLLDSISATLRGEERQSMTPEGRQAVNIDTSSIPASQVKPVTRTNDNPNVTIGIWTWQTESGLIDAVGGTGSSGDHPDACLYQSGITNTKLVVMNDTSEQIKAISTGSMQIGTTTGDQSAVDLAGLNGLLRRNGAKAFFSAGYSNGEDAFFAPASIKKNPQEARGIVVVTAVPYCDWNVVVDWASDNKIPVNPDESVYDPDAINFVNAVDHLEAAQKYVQNAKVSLRNKVTGQTEQRQIDAVSTWTPGDVEAVEGRPTVTYKNRNEKLDRIISTREYNFMMPNILFTTDTFIKEHPEYLKTLATCVLRSNDKIKSDLSYLNNRIGVLNAVMFNVAGRGANFWSTYFKGSEINGVPLGGSRVNNLAEVRHLFGLDQNVTVDQSVFGITYSDHAKRVQQFMPDRLANHVPASQVVDTSIIQAITAGGERASSTTYTPQFEASNQGSTFISANYNIIFDSGSATVKPTTENLKALNEMFNALTRAGNTKVLLEGHTDNVGDAGKNLSLSQQRAQAVWQFLKQMDRSGIITESRLQGIEGYGSYRPVSDNNSEQGKALNRRVTIVLK
jgi:outer membrane protein OmpA-like peptidoglycan-associated protein